VYFVLDQHKKTYPYDFVIEEDGVLKKVKCQIGRVENFNITFWTTTAAHKDVDLIYVYVSEWKKIYRVPSPIAIASFGILRYYTLRHPKKLVFAKDYED
jgi:hypothetical protein